MPTYVKGGYIREVRKQYWESPKDEEVSTPKTRHSSYNTAIARINMLMQRANGEDLQTSYSKAHHIISQFQKMRYEVSHSNLNGDADISQPDSIDIENRDGSHIIIARDALFYVEYVPCPKS